MEADEAVVVFWLPPTLDVPIATGAETAVDSGTQRVALDKIIELIVLVVPRSEEFEGFRIATVVADRLQNHVVSLLQGNKSHVLHSLYEWNHFSEAFLCFILLMHNNGMPLMDVVTTPQVEAEHETEEVFG